MMLIFISTHIIYVLIMKSKDFNKKSRSFDRDAISSDFFFSELGWTGERLKDQ